MNINRVAAMVTSIAVLIVVIAAFELLGSPTDQRLQRLDERRVSDLQQLAQAVDTYHAQRDALPEDLEALVDGRRLSRLPTDPASDQPYRYEPLADHRYRLCASFARASAPESPPAFWQHDAGSSCFEFEATDDPSLRPGILPRY